LIAAAIFIFEETREGDPTTVVKSAIPPEDSNKLLSPVSIPTGTPALVTTPSPYPLRLPTVQPTESIAAPVAIQKTTDSPTPSPAGSRDTDYTRIFSGTDVSTKARVLEKPEPAYTEAGKRNQITGTVVLRAVFSASGQVTNIHAVSTLPDGLTEQAIAAAKKIRFVPAMKDGHPVSMWMELQYNFNLY
jgi:TonB family protein